MAYIYLQFLCLLIYKRKNKPETHANQYQNEIPAFQYKGKPGSLSVQLIKGRETRLKAIKGIRIYPEEWDGRNNVRAGSKPARTESALLFSPMRHLALKLYLQYPKGIKYSSGW